MQFQIWQNIVIIYNHMPIMKLMFNLTYISGLWIPHN